MNKEIISTKNLYIKSNIVKSWKVAMNIYIYIYMYTVIKLKQNWDLFSKGMQSTN